MAPAPLRGALAGTALAALALTAVPALAADGARATNALPADVLDLLPDDAADAGLDFAPRLLSVDAATQRLRSLVADTGLDVTEHAGDDFVEVVVYSQEELDLLEDLGFTYEVEIADMIAREAERVRLDSAFAAANPITELPSGRNSYRVLDDFGAEIDQLVADNPGVAKRISLGESVEGRDLTGIEIGVGVDGPEDGRPVLLMFGNHHAREWPSAEAPMEFAHDLLGRFAEGDARTVDLLSRTRVIIVPVSNPDGFTVSRQWGDLIDLNVINDVDPLAGTTAILATPGGAYKRKNCSVGEGQSLPDGGCFAAPSPGGQGIGVDLNRNYGALWGGPGAVGTEPDPNQSINGLGPLSPIYRGPAPFSEPETQAIRELISTRQVTTLISNHTFSNLLLRPVGVQPDTIGPDGFPIGFAPDECFTTADGDDYGMQSLGERMTAQTGYSNQFGWELYDTTGTTEDYSYNATGGYGYTFEIGPDEFHPPYEEYVEEYLGTSASAQAVTPESARALTTSTGQGCEGDPVEHDTVGGGLREAYWIALENAANSATHSVVAGEAPAGAEITVERAGTFPLWDGTAFEDLVRTTMTVGDDGTFEYHVNPSTRPFVASRPYSDGPVSTGGLVETGTQEASGDVTTTPPTQSTDVTIEVPAGTEVLVAELSSSGPADDWDLELFDPEGISLGTSASGGSDEFVRHDSPAGIVPGEYVARVTNFSAVTTWDLVATLGTLPEASAPQELLSTPGETEAWTVTCTVDGTEQARDEVVVDRGEQVDLGTFCTSSGGSVDEPAPAPGVDSTPLPATGGGLAALGLLSLAGALRLRRR